MQVAHHPISDNSKKYFCSINPINLYICILYIGYLGKNLFFLNPLQPIPLQNTAARDLQSSQRKASIKQPIAAQYCWRGRGGKILKKNTMLKTSFVRICRQEGSITGEFTNIHRGPWRFVLVRGTQITRSREPTYNDYKGVVPFCHAIFMSFDKVR